MVRLRLSTLLLAAAFGSMVGCSSTSRFNLFHRNTTTTTMEACPEAGMGQCCEGSGMADHMGVDANSTMLMPETSFPQGTVMPPGTMLPQGTMMPPGSMPPQGTVLPMSPTPLGTSPPPGALQTAPPPSRLQPAPIRPMPSTQP